MPPGRSCCRSSRRGRACAALEAIAAGARWSATAVGPLPEVVGAAGLLVGPRDVDRMATALHALWLDGPVHDQVSTEARLRAASDGRTWADVAADTRALYRTVGAAGLHRLPV